MIASLTLARHNAVAYSRNYFDAVMTRAEGVSLERLG